MSNPISGEGNRISFLMSLHRLLSKGPGMAIKRTNLQAGLCDANGMKVTQGHQILEGNEDSYFCTLQGLQLSLWPMMQRLFQETFSCGIWFLLLGRKINHAGETNAQLPTGGRREICANSAGKHVWDGCVLLHTQFPQPRKEEGDL